MKILRYSGLYLGYLTALVVSVPLIAFYYGLNLSIEFTGGSFIKLPSEALTVSEVENTLGSITSATYSIVQTGDSIEVKSNELTESDLNLLSNSLPITSIENVGPAFSQQLIRSSIMSLLVAVAAIVAYISYTFRNVNAPFSSFKFALSAITALLHDLLIIFFLGLLLSSYFNYQFDTLFVTAVLTILGFSVHDTIVVLDRVRENAEKIKKKFDLVDLLNLSLSQVVVRSLSTSVTALLPLITLYLIVGGSISYFVLIIIVGLLSGTLSSYFIAPSILILLHKKR
jgi:preprotein translocase subunit SecF